MGVRGYFLKKRKLYMQNLAKERKQPPVVILQKSIFYNIFIRCLRLRIIRRSDYGVLLMNFRSQIFFNDINHGYRATILKKSFLWLLPFYMAVATYCFYKKIRRTMRTAIVSYLLKNKYNINALTFWNRYQRCKGAPKLYFKHFLLVTINLFSTSLNKSAFSTQSFGKLGFCPFIFYVCSVFWIWCIITIYISIRYSVILFSLYKNYL